MNLINLLVYLIVFCIVFGLLYWLITMLPLPGPFKQIALVAMILIAVIILLAWMLGGLNGPGLRVGLLEHWHGITGSLT